MIQDVLQIEYRNGMLEKGVLKAEGAIHYQECLRKLRD